MTHSETEGSEREQAAAEAVPVPPPEPPLSFTPDGEYTGEHAQVFTALAAAQEARAGESVGLAEVAGATRLTPDRAQALLHDLAATFRLVTALPPDDAAGGEPRYAVKPRL
jgi:hypothetical protein